MISLKLNGKKVTCPGCYEELSTGTYQRIMREWDLEKPVEDRDYFKLFCILTNSDFKSFQNTAENEVTIWNAIKWFIQQPYAFPKHLPSVLKIGKTAVTIPLKIGELGIGQNIHLRQAIDKTKFLEENISIAIAICLQPLIDNSKFNITRVKELEKDICELPIHLTHPIGFFLLNRVKRNGWKRQRNLKQILINLGQNLKRMLPRWLRSGGSKNSMIFQSSENTRSISVWILTMSSTILHSTL